MKTITLDTLGDLSNGEARGVVNAAINAAIADVEDRGEDDGKARKVTITLTLKKLDNGAVGAHVEAKTTVPAYLTKTTIANLRLEDRRPVAEFNEFSPANPNQRSFPEIEKEAN